MGLFGSLVGLGFGGPPEPLPWQPLDMAASQKKSVGENLAILPSASDLASRTNLFNRSEIDKMLRDAIPNYDEIRKTTSANILAETRGEIPKDVESAIERSAAASAIAGGYSGSGMHRNLVARDLGLTSLNLIDKGLNSAESWTRTMASLYEPGMMNVTSMFVSPAMQWAADVSERDKRLSYENAARQFKYNSDPMRGVESSIGGIADMFGTALGGWMGGFGGLGSIGGGMMSLGGGGGGGGFGSIFSSFGDLFGGGNSTPNYGFGGRGWSGFG